jgi:hypothetical protein
VTYCSFACRLWSKIDVRGPDECWPWNGTAKRYGSVMLPDQRNVGAHRALYELIHGPLKTEEFVCHSCDNKICCNPAHLWVGSTTENIRDAAKKGLLCRGSEVTHSRITEEQARIIRNFSFELFSHQDIANVLGCHKESVGRIVRRETWSHLE